jgi:hypothetical protein
LGDFKSQPAADLSSKPKTYQKAKKQEAPALKSRRSSFDHAFRASFRSDLLTSTFSDGCGRLLSLLTFSDVL